MNCYKPDDITACKSSPFGSAMPSRSYSSSDYRYGFNGHEKLEDWNQEGNVLDFGARIYDSRIGRFLSTDPYQNIFPGSSTYSYAFNNPIRFVDVEGMWPGDANLLIQIGDWKGGAVLKQGDWTVVYANSFEQALELMVTKGLKKKTFDNLLIKTHGLGSSIVPSTFVGQAKPQIPVKTSDLKKATSNKQIHAISHILEYLDKNPSIVLGSCQVAASEEFNQLFYEFVSDKISGNFDLYAPTVSLSTSTAKKPDSNKDNNFEYYHSIPKFNENVIPQIDENTGEGIVKLNKNGSSDFVFNSFIYGKSNPIFGNIFKFDNKQKRKTPGRAKF